MRAWTVLTIAGVALATVGGALAQDEAKLGDKPLTELLRQLQSENRGLQLRAAQALSGAPAELQPQIVPKLIHLLKSERENDKFVAAQTLGEYGPVAKAAIPDLLPMLEGTQYERNRAAAAKALGQILKDLPPSEEIGKVTQALMRVFPDKYSDVRREAVRACGMIGPAAKDCVPLLVPRLEDFEQWKGFDELFVVRRAAAWTAGRMGKHSECLIDRLIAQMHSYKPEAPEWVDAIGEIGLVHDNVMPNLVARLEKAVFGQWLINLDQFDVYVQHHLAVLEKFGPRSGPAVELLMRIMESGQMDRFPAWSVCLMKTLGAIGPAAEIAVPLIEKKGLASKRSEVNKAAREALEKIHAKAAS